MYLPVTNRTARGPSNGPYDSNVRQPTRHREPKAHRRYYRARGLGGSGLGAAPAARASARRRCSGLGVACSASKNLSNQRSVQLRTPCLCQKDTRERREGTLADQIFGSGDSPKDPGFLDFPQRSPYTDPVFKLSVRPPTGGAARGAGRSDRRRRSPHVRVVLPALHPPLGLSSPWDDPGVRSSEDTGMPTGTIARLLIDKGFGFIRDESGIEHFFHRSSVRGAVFELLREGQRVEFTPEESGKGPRAGEVRLIEG